MMTNLIDKIEARYAENKNSFKTYATYKNAERAIIPQLLEVAVMHDLPMDMVYMPVQIPSCGRWTVVVMYASWMKKHDLGAYVFEFSSRGFWQA